MPRADSPRVRLRANLQSRAHPIHVHVAGSIGRIVESLRPGWWTVELGSSWTELVELHEDDFVVLQEAVG